MIKRNLFCASCQKATEQVFTIEGAELTASCGCGRQLKWSAGMSSEDLKRAFEAHAKDNAGQIPAPTTLEAGTNTHPALEAVAQLL